MFFPGMSGEGKIFAPPISNEHPLKHSVDLFVVLSYLNNKHLGDTHEDFRFQCTVSSEQDYHRKGGERGRGVV